MRVWLLAIIVVGIISSCSHSDSLNVCSFYTGNEFDKSSSELWVERLTTIELLVSSGDFDIIGMQEVNFARFYSLQEALSEYEIVIGDGEKRLEVEELAPIFYKSDKFILLSKSVFWLSETPDIPGSKSWGAIYPRIATWVKLQNKYSGHIFYVFNTHFCQLNEDAQLKSSKLLLQKINEIAGDAPVIVTGNFNAAINSPVELFLTSNWDRFHSLRNAAKIIKNKKLARETKELSKRFVPTRHTDHIFINSYFKTQLYSTVQSKEIEKLFTGHRPASVKIKFLFERIPRDGELQPVPWKNKPAI
jgi:endonuclease/exonuclease/phosphatase family metal-dependent hydrolase